MESNNRIGDIIEIGSLCKGDFFEKNNYLYKFGGKCPARSNSTGTCFTKGLKLADVDFFENNDTAIYKGFQILK